MADTLDSHSEAVKAFSQAVSRYTASLPDTEDTPVKLLNLLSERNQRLTDLVQQMDRYDVGFIDLARALTVLSDAGFLSTHTMAQDVEFALTPEGAALTQSTDLVPA